MDAGSGDGTSDTDGWPNRLGNSFAISPAHHHHHNQIKSKAHTCNEHQPSRRRARSTEESGSGLTGVAGGGAGGAVGEGEGGAEDGGEGERVLEAAGLHLAVDRREPGGGGRVGRLRAVAAAVRRHRRRRHAPRDLVWFWSGFGGGREYAERAQSGWVGATPLGFMMSGDWIGSVGSRAGGGGVVLGCWFCGEAPRICGEFPSLVCGGGDVETGGGLGGWFCDWDPGNSRNSAFGLGLCAERKVRRSLARLARLRRLVVFS